MSHKEDIRASDAFDKPTPAVREALACPYHPFEYAEDCKHCTPPSQEKSIPGVEWENELKKLPIFSAPIVYDMENSIKFVANAQMVEDFIKNLLSSTLERYKRETERNVGAMRQWLNEDRITEPKKMVTNEELRFWLFNELKK